MRPTPCPLGKLTLRLRQGVTTDSELAGEATLTQRAESIVDHRPTKRLSGFLLWAFAKNESLSGNEIDLLSYHVLTGLNFRVLSWLEASMTYSYVEQISDGMTGNDGERNQVFIGVRAISLPWRFGE